MIRNNLKIALRNFSRHKLFTFINIIGLSIGISAALVVYLIVNYDFSFDKFHKDRNRIFRVVTNFSVSGEPGYNSGVLGPLPDAVKNNVTGLESSAPFFMVNSPVVIIPNKTDIKFKHQNNIVFADGRYFNLFQYKWLAGSAKIALNEPNKVVLSSEQAQMYFPGLTYDNMLGRNVIYGDSIRTTVTGIVESFKNNTDFTFHDFISYSTGRSYDAFKREMSLDRWGGISPACQFFVKLSGNASPEIVQRQLNEVVKKNNPPTNMGKGNSIELKLQPLDDLHFNQNYGNFTGRTVSKSTLYGLLAIGAFLLILGCINFINLTTAQSAQRAKEIGIRKTIGSSRKQLISQFLSETFLITLFSVIVSFICTPFVLRLFADFIPKGLTIAAVYQPSILVFLSVLIIGVSFLSGLYPALILSSGRPIMILKSRSQEGASRSTILRKSLTVTQFIIAQFFIMSTMLVSKQIYYALHKDLGFKKDAIVSIAPAWSNMNESQKNVFLENIRALPQVETISLGGASPSSDNTHSTSLLYKDGKKEIETGAQERFGDENYIKVYNIKLLAGRNIMKGEANALLINKTFAQSIGFKNPSDAVGKVLNYNSAQVRIVGVVADFYYRSLRTAIEPLIIVHSANPYFSSTFHIALKPQVAGSEWRTALASMESSWKAIYPNDDFEYHFFDDSIAKFYENDLNTSILLSWATGLAILISCLGLLGLAIHTTSQRTKEIGVRKVLGATVAQLVVLLSSELILLVFIAFIIVSPAAWWAMNKWMESFTDKTSISWWIFAASGGGMLFVALFTTIFQTSRAALTNPVKSLKSE